jgi:hypothetical protein
MANARHNVTVMTTMLIVEQNSRSIMKIISFCFSFFCYRPALTCLKCLALALIALLYGVSLYDVSAIEVCIVKMQLIVILVFPENSLIVSVLCIQEVVLIIF